MIYNESFYLRELARQIEEKVKFRLVSFQDCKAFIEILDECGIHISAHTVARVFGVLKSKHRPYVSTLNLLANYLGFDTYSQFAKDVENQAKYSLAHPTEAFETGAFSFTALELGLQNSDWVALRTLLDAYHPNKMNRLDFHNFFGNKVRSHANRDELLRFLAGFKSGRINFYEGFVDDDDPESYFSNALLHYYKKPKLSLNEELFIASFLGTKNIYNRKKNEPANPNVLKVAKEQINTFPSQLISRYFELNILIEGTHSNRKHKINQIVDKMLTHLPSFNAREQSWILGRPIKALAFTNNLKQSLENKEFSECILKNYVELGNKINSNGELFIQLTAHNFMKDQLNPAISPKRMSLNVLNEDVDRILIESSTAYIYSAEPVQRILEKNLTQHLRVCKNKWISEFLMNS